MSKGGIGELGHATPRGVSAFRPIMHDHNFQRLSSVLAVIAIAALLLGAILWLGVRKIEVTPRQPSAGQGGERRGAAEDILPAIIRVPICDDERPCS